MIKVEVAYARPDEQIILQFEIEKGSTVEQVLQASGIFERFPEIDTEKAKVGIFGKLCKRDVMPKAGDRIEIYRPLIADPKAVRKKRAAEGKVMKKGGGAVKPKAD
ncbi:MAG: RnfH family protein [Gammaproteobacteria bacterium]|nr:RnfH family protein [Gammaproteobacteria bacterium]